MKKKFITAFMCASIILTGCAAQENNKYQDGQEITTLDFNDLLQENDTQTFEREETTAAPKYLENNRNTENTENTETAQTAQIVEDLETQPQVATDSTQEKKSANDLYTGFIKNEVPVIIAGNYPQMDYTTYNLEPGSSYTFTELGEFVNKSYFRLEQSEEISYDYAQYTYLDCPDSTAKNLLIKFSGLGIYAPDDDSFAVYVIAEKDGQLYLTDFYECWARSGTRACKKGLLVSDGSNGAGDHFSGVSAVMTNGEITEIYGAEILTGWWASYVSNGTLYREVFADNEDIIFSVIIYTIGEKVYYTYDWSECTEDQISLCETYINRCREEIGIDWVTEEVVEEAIKEQCGLLGVDYNDIGQVEEVAWTNL